MSQTITVDADIDIECDACGTTLSCNFYKGTLKVPVCECQTKEITRLEELVEDKNTLITELEEHLETVKSEMLDLTAIIESRK